MDSIIFAVVSAATRTTIQAIIAAFGTTDADEEAARVIEKTYDVLKLNLTGGCARLLKLLETASLTDTLYRPPQIRKQLYPSLRMSDDNLDAFDGEFRYRLEYLKLNGLVELVSGTEYGISRLGLAFLAEARRRRHFTKELTSR